MGFQPPDYTPPDFSSSFFRHSPVARFEPVEQEGVAPENYHATSIFPEYLQIQQNNWQLIPRSRMDCVVVLKPDNSLEAVEFRRLQRGEQVAIGRTENGEDGIFIHTAGFALGGQEVDKFAFRSNRTRETSFSIDYDELYELMRYEREQGFVVWVMGPAVIFDHDARTAFSQLIDQGYVHALLAGNALATHDIEGSMFGTALGQELYHKRSVAGGHYKHLDVLNSIHRCGSITTAIEKEIVQDGVMYSLNKKNIPYVLAGSIRDDGPLPEVIKDITQAQDQMRKLTGRATTILGLATQLHTIAAGNMTPSYTTDKSGLIRPVYFYSVDMSEFAVNKLSDRGSLSATPILTNVQDFVVTLLRGLQ